MEFLNQIENQFANIEAIRANLLEPKKVQLHPNIEGYDSPETYGIYRNGGGAPIGVVGRVFEPMDLNLFLDSIAHSLVECTDLDLNKLEYNEYKNGAKVEFRIPLPIIEYKRSKMVGDITERWLQFNTGFDGLTKASLGVFSNRLWCTNGATETIKQDLKAYKNTINNQVKIMNLCDDIVKRINLSDEFALKVDELNRYEYTQKNLDDFLTKITGYKVSEYKDLTTRKRNILDKINANIAIESTNTGTNYFSLVNGVTRYTTHDLASGDTEKMLFSSATKLAEKAHTVAFDTCFN